MSRTSTLALLISLILFGFAENMFSQCPITLDAGPDIYACAPPSPVTVQLEATLTGTAIDLLWTPNPFTILNPTISVSAPVSTYVIQGRAVNESVNLIFNGDFEQGNTGFNPGLEYSPGDLTAPDTYDVLTNPSTANPAYGNCPDHTSGEGNMMAIHPNTKETQAWCQTVTVEPYTTYLATYYIQKLLGGSPTNKSWLSIDGLEVLTGGTGSTCIWQKVSGFISIGNQTSVEVCISAKNNSALPNKKLGAFALDDISLNPVCTVKDSVNVYVKTIATAPAANYTLPCEGSPITINATAGTTLGDFITYEWSTPNGNFVSGTNSLTPVVDQSGSYWIDLKYQNSTHTCNVRSGFVVKEGVQLSVNIIPTQSISCYTPNVALKALPNFPLDILYSWTAEEGGNIVSGETTASPLINQAGVYKVLITNSKTGCTATGEYEVQPPPAPPVAIANATPITCAQPQAALLGTGSTTGVGIVYTWTTPNGNISSDPKKINSTASVPGTYILEIRELATGCRVYDTVTVVGNVEKPTLAIAPPGILSCKPDTITLAATFTPANTLLAWSASGGGSIASGANSPAPRVTSSGTYTLTATNPLNGCTVTASASVQNTVNLTLAVTPPGILTCAQPALALNATGSSSGPGITYAWTTANGNIQSGASTLQPIVTAPGSYQIVVSEPSSGCSKSLIVNVFDSILTPELQAVAPVALSCATPTATLSALRLDSLPNVVYQWATANGTLLAGANTLAPTIGLASSESTYTLTAVNTDNGCASTLAIPVTADVQPPALQLAPAPALDCTTLSLDLSAAASSASGQLLYTWAASNGGNILSGSATAAPKIDQPGTYALLVTDPTNGCTATASVAVALNNAPPTIDAGPSDVLTCATASLVLSGTASGASSNLTYQWTTSNGGNIIGSATGLAPQIDRPGTYTLLVTDLNNGCTATDAVSIAENKTLPTADAGADQTLSCGKFTATLNGGATANGSLTYTWTTAGGNFAAGENTLSPTVDAPGTYLLLVTDTQNGCTASDQTLVQKDANVPTAIAQAPSPLNCLTSSVLLSAVGASQGPNFIYTWSTMGGNIVSGNNTLSPTVNAPGIYTLSVFNTISQCTATASAAVLEDRQIPVADIQSPSVLTCAALSFSLDASGSAQGSAYAYTWAASSGGNITSGASGLSPTVDQPGTYALTVTNTQNGCTASDIVTVLKNTAIPEAKANAVGKITCTNPTLTLSGAGSATGGNFTYQWSTANGNFATGATTLTPVVDAPGLYVLLVTDNQNGCTATDQVVVEKDANVPLAAIQVPGALTCSTPTLQLSAVGTSQGAGITYLWTTPNGSIVSGGNTLAPTVNAAGTYTLQVSNTASACTAVATLTVLDDKVPPIAKVAAPPAITCKNLVVSLDGVGSSTGPNFVYLWATTSGNFVSGKNTLTPTVDQPGIYNLLITNTSNGCTITATAAVEANQTAPLAQIAPAPQLNCTTAAIQLNGLGSSSTPGLSYQWTATSGGNITSGGGSLTPTVNAPGTYVLLISDPANGCTAQANVAVSRDVQPPIASVAPPALLNCTVAEISLDGLTSSTGPNFAYLWTTASGNFVSGKNTLSPTVNQPGAYNLLITNTSNGCTATASVTVGQDIAVPQVDAGVSQTFLCNTSSLALTATATGAGTAAQITWSTPDGLILSGTNTLSPAIGLAGTYTLLVKNLQNGCTQSDAVTILKDQNAPLSAAAVSGQLTCQVAQVVLNGAGSSTGAQYTYSWGVASGGIVPGGNVLSPTVSKPGIYTLMVTDLANNCTTTATVEVTEDKTPPPASAVANDALTCKVGQVQISGSSPVNVAYVWSGLGIVAGGNTPSPTVKTAGVYALLVTDLDNGCTGTASVQVVENKTLPIAAVAPPAQLNCLVLNASLNGTGSSTGNDFAYLWVGPGLVSGTTALQATVDEPGVYLLQVVNQANGCTASATATATQDKQPPKAQASGGFELNCLVEDGTLSALGSSTGAQFIYVWSGTGIVAGANTAAPKVSEPGLYTLMVRNTANGCTAVASVPVTENTSQPTGLMRSFSPPNCKGQPGSIRFEEVLGGTAPYAYSIDGGATFGTVKQFEKLLSGTYALLVQDANGCEYTEPLTLLAPVLPKLSIQPEVEVDFGEKKTLTATLNIPLSEVDTIIWSPEEGLTRTAEPHVVIAQPLRSTQYQVRVVNKDGCDDRALLTVRVDKPSLWAPNVFSPKRRDGQNDWFLIFAGEGAVRNIRTLQIFDRWGTMVFRNDDLQPNVEKMGWDGGFRGVVMQPAVFAWYAEVVLSSGEEIILKGDVTIVD